MKFIKQITRIIFAVPLCLLGLSLFDFGSFANVFMFLIIYIGVSLILESLFVNLEKNRKSKITKNNNYV